MTDTRNDLGINKTRPVITNIYDSGVQNMGAQPIPLNNNPIRANYPVDCLLIKLLVVTTVGTGTLASVPIFNALQNLQLNDSENNQILNFLGTDVIFEAYTRSLIQSKYYEQQNLLGQLGAGATALTANVASGSNEATVLLKCPIKNKNLGIKILGYFAATSAIFSSLGTGTATCELVIDAIMYPTVDPVYTQRSNKYNTGAAVPVGAGQDISKIIPAGVIIDAIILNVGADANINAITLDPNGNGTGIQQETADSIKQSETARLAPVSRQAGYVILDVGQFTYTSKTKFTVDVATGFTPYAIILFHPVTDAPKVIQPTTGNRPAAPQRQVAPAQAQS